ncbi:hypothetical protein B0T20DRAFT_150241 [Sordaria brevicollis]|uniref:Mitochondrial inner membrane protein 1 n=1 Tax=Sordaria brevicollis TaxID=83679 RepID=A0AAE0PIU7_SORBR|nr:hypothetical protein B0T20DRAFT_150241 [Sordaria brevicollis]
MMLRTSRPLMGTAQRLPLLVRSAHTKSFNRPVATPLSRNAQIPKTSSASLVFRSAFSSKPPLQPNEIDTEREKKLAQQKLKVDPENITEDSSVRPLFEQDQAAPSGVKAKDTSESLKDDLGLVKDTLALKTVPRETYALGFAGTIPYLATSLSTVYLSWNLNQRYPAESDLLNTILFRHETVRDLLDIIEPLQVGYGAVIISFLGAIHWGLEFAEKTPSHARTRFRYGMGLLAPIIAWPTTLMSIQWALTTQFLAFTGLYYADSRATVRGWAPAWYATYRFVLTGIVGIALFISILGRLKIGETHARLSTEELTDLVSYKTGADKPYHDWAKEEAEERKRIKKEKQEEEKKKKEEEAKKKQEEKVDKQKNKGSSEQKEKSENNDDVDSKKDGDKNVNPESKKSPADKSDDKESKEDKSEDKSKDN